jgi:hypothetical protein
MTKKGTRIGRSRNEPGLALTPDAERVLGQIERGEVRAGPEAAREIAAKAEAAYGEAFRHGE